MFAVPEEFVVEVAEGVDDVGREGTAVVEHQGAEEGGAATDGEGREVEGVFGEVVGHAEGEVLDEGYLLHFGGGVEGILPFDFQVVAYGGAQGAAAAVGRAAIEAVLEDGVAVDVACGVGVLLPPAEALAAEVGVVGEGEGGVDDVADGLQRAALELEHAVDTGGERRRDVEVAVGTEALDSVGGDQARGVVVALLNGAPVPPLVEGHAVGPVEEVEDLEGGGEGDGVGDAVLHAVEGGVGEEVGVLGGDVVLGVEDIGEGDVLVPAVAAHGVAAPQGVEGDGGERDAGQFDVHQARLGVVALACREGEVEGGAQLGAVADGGGGGGVEVVVAVGGVAVVVAALEGDVGREAGVGVGLGVLLVGPDEFEVGEGVVGGAVAIDALVGDAVAGVDLPLVLVALVVVGLGLEGPREVGIEVAQQGEVPVVAQGEVVAAVLQVVATVVLPAVGGEEDARLAALGDGEEGEGQRDGRGHVLDGEPRRTRDDFVAHDELALGEVQREVGVDVVAGGVAAAGEVHHGVVELLHRLAVEEALALLGDDAVDEAALGVVVEADGVGVVFGAVLDEEGTSHGLACRVDAAVGVEDVAVEVEVDAVGTQQHAVVVDDAVAVERGLARLEVHGHRVLGLVLDDALHGVARHMRQGVDVALRQGRVGEEEEKGKEESEKWKVESDFEGPGILKAFKSALLNYVFPSVQLSFKTLFFLFKKSSYFCILNLQR